MKQANHGTGEVNNVEPPQRLPNHVTNGLLLRADLHTLFDCDLLAVDPKTLTVIVAPSVRDSDYGALQGISMRPPVTPGAAPSPLALAHHLKQTGLIGPSESTSDVGIAYDPSSVGHKVQSLTGP